MNIDHIGIVVPSLQRGIQEWESLFSYKQISPIVDNSRQEVRVVFLAKDGSLTVKLVEPSGPDSPVASYARKGGGLHHLCFRCDDLEIAVPLMKQEGVRFLVAPQPGEAFCGHRIAFCLTQGSLNIELIDTDEKALFGAAEQHQEMM